MGATKDCTSAIDLNPYYHEAYKVRALSYINQDYYKEAAEDYKKLLSLSPDDPKDWQNFACCYINLDSLEQMTSQALSSAFQNCRKLQELSFPSLPAIHSYIV